MKEPWRLLHLRKVRYVLTDASAGAEGRYFCIDFQLQVD